MNAKRAFLTLLSLFSMSAMAHAEPVSTVGEAIKSALTNLWNPFLLLIIGLSFIAGLYILIRGLLKITQTAQNNGNGGYGSGLAHIALAAFLIALPQASGMGMNTLFDSARGGSQMTSGAMDYDDSGRTNFLNTVMGGPGSVGSVDNCLSDPAPAVCMSKNIATNIIPIAIVMLFGMTFLGGMALAGTTIVEWAKSADRNDQSKAHIAKLVTAILLMNASVLFRIATNTLMGQDSPITDLGHLDAASSLLSYSGGSKIEVVQHFSALLSNSFKILAFFGAWAFIRGIFMLNSVATQGKNGGSYGMAATYIVAGILLANAKFSTCLILATVGGADMGAGFCN